MILNSILQEMNNKELIEAQNRISIIEKHLELNKKPTTKKWYQNTLIQSALVIISWIIIDFITIILTAS